VTTEFAPANHRDSAHAIGAAVGMKQVLRQPEPNPAACNRQFIEWTSRCVAAEGELLEDDG
jgi:hypothetical protein